MSLRVRLHKDGTLTAETELPEVHHFDPIWVNRMVGEGLVSVHKGQIVLHLEEGDAQYNILRGPGVYCSECGDRIAEGPARSAAEVASQTALLCAGADREVLTYWDTEKE